MVVSSWFGTTGAIGEATAGYAPKRAGRSVDGNLAPAKLNETGTGASERVHLREIVEIPARRR
jgi:hypothetical protein